MIFVLTKVIFLDNIVFDKKSLKLFTQTFVF